MKILVMGDCALTKAIATALLAALAGCGTVETVTVYKEKAILAPEEMVTLCDIIRPPPPEYLMSLSKTQRLNAVMDTLDAQYLSMKVCNVKIDSYLNWRKKQEVFYKTMNGESNASEQNPK